MRRTSRRIPRQVPREFPNGRFVPDPTRPSPAQLGSTKPNPASFRALMIRHTPASDEHEEPDALAVLRPLHPRLRSSAPTHARARGSSDAVAAARLLHVVVVGACRPGNAEGGLGGGHGDPSSAPQRGGPRLSQHFEPAYMLKLVGDDASGVGCLLKDGVRDVGEFLDAVERVADGGTAFDPFVVNALVTG